MARCRRRGPNAMPEVDIQSPEHLAPDEDARNRGVVEALLIASDTPIGAGKLISMLHEVGAREIRCYVDELNDDYIRTGRSFRIVEVAGGYQMAVHPEYAPWIRQLLREKAPARLSQAALETLAIIAFKQPVVKVEVENIRGVAVDGVLRHLLEKGLVRIAGRAEGMGRPLLYGTTRDFLKHFGLKTLSDLPKVRELEELLREEEQRTSSGVPVEALSQTEVQGAEGTPQPGGEEADGGAPEGSRDSGSGAGDGTAGASEPVSGPGGDRLPEGERPADSGGKDPG